MAQAPIATPSWHSVAAFFKIDNGTVLNAAAIDFYIAEYIRLVWNKDAQQTP